MKLEQQVVSLELAKKLKELGVKNESLYAYFQKSANGGYYLGTWNEHTPANAFARVTSSIISAYTVSELGEMLLCFPYPYKLQTQWYQGGEVRVELIFVRYYRGKYRESTLYAKGIKHFVERSDILKVKNKIKDGHISDTRFEDFTKVIPKDVLKKKKEVESFSEKRNKIYEKMLKFNIQRIDNKDEVYTEANARAKILIYLLENKLITL